MTDTSTILLFGVMMIEFIMIVPFLIWIRLGGNPEGTYRIFRVKYFVYWVVDHDGSLVRNTMKWSRIMTKSPAHFVDDKNGDPSMTRYVDKQNTGRSRGRPAWMYHIDNAIPIPYISGYRDKVLDPITINRAYRTEIDRRLDRIGRERPISAKRISAWIVVLFLLVLTLSGFYLYFTRLPVKP